jgi:tetratricopeptide (TPR) repeat protein
VKHFFISYNKADRDWAEWIAWTLEEAGYSVVTQAWDFRPGGNFVLEMHKAAAETEKTVLVLSEDYLKAEFTHPEWAAALARDPQSRERTLIPVRVRECNPGGLLGQIMDVDFAARTEEDARSTLLGAFAERAKPDQAPAFPGAAPAVSRPARQHVVPMPFQYPGTVEKAGDDSWSVPIPPNPFFTGREKVLAEVEKELHAGGPVALTGIAGVGKTQIAAHFAHEHRDEYSAVLWASAASQETLVSDFAAIAGLLNLPEKDEKDQTLAVAVVKRWLEANGGWLLILDNANDLVVARAFIPPAARGHILLTTQAQATGAIPSIEIPDMLPEDGALLLLRRAKIMKADAPLAVAAEPAHATALHLSRELGGLPLALDQAGAFIEETGCALASYLDLYRQRRAELLDVRGGFGPDHPDSVATTFELSFERVASASPAAADLLRLCAFLHPDAIPEEILTEGAAELGPNLGPVAADPLKLNAAFAEILKYSLLRRDADANSLGIHRLIQVVIQDGLTEQQKRQWAERAVRAVNRTFPVVEFANWAQCERLVPQALACASLVETYLFEFKEAARLLNKAGYYLDDRARFSGVEPLYQRTLGILEKALGPEHPDVATSLSNLALLYDDQGKYAQAEPLFHRALAIDEKALGPNHPGVVTDLNNLAALYCEQGKYAQAEPLYERALAVDEKSLGPNHPSLASDLDKLAALYCEQGKYAQAEPLYRRALAILEKALGPDHPDVATSLNNLALLYQNQGKCAQAEPLYQRALAIREKALGSDHPQVATSLNHLASLCKDQGKYAEAEPLFQRALAIDEKALGPDHPNVATGLNNLAALYEDQGKYAQAEPLHQRALAIKEKALGPEHPEVATSLNNLAALYYEQGKHTQAEPLLQRALVIKEKVLGPGHPDTATILENYALLLREMKRDAAARELEARAQAIRAAHAKHNPPK